MPIKQCQDFPLVLIRMKFKKKPSKMHFPDCSFCSLNSTQNCKLFSISYSHALLLFIYLFCSTNSPKIGVIHHQKCQRKETNLDVWSCWTHCIGDWVQPFTQVNKYHQVILSDGSQLLPVFPPALPCPWTWRGDLWCSTPGAWCLGALTLFHLRLDVWSGNLKWSR